MPNIDPKILEQYVVTANSGKYGSWEEVNEKFPELKGYDPKVLEQYVVTANSGKYNSWEEINSRFPEFQLKKKESTQEASQTSGSPSPSVSSGSLEEQLAQAPPIPAGATVDVPAIAPNIQAGTEQPTQVQQQPIPEVKKDPILPTSPVEERFNASLNKLNAYDQALTQKKEEVERAKGIADADPSESNIREFNRLAGEYNSELTKAQNEQNSYNNLVKEYSQSNESPVFAGTFTEMMKDIKPYENAIPVPTELGTWENIANNLSNSNDNLWRNIAKFTARGVTAAGGGLGAAETAAELVDLKMSKYYPATRNVKAAEDMNMLEAATAQFAQSAPIMLLAVATGGGGAALAGNVGMRAVGSVPMFITGFEEGMKAAEEAGVTGQDKYNYATLMGSFEAISEMILPDAKLIKPLKDKLFKDIIRQGAKGLSKEDLPMYMKDFAAKGALEFGEELFVEFTTMLTDYAYSSGLGYDELTPEMMSAREYGIMAMSVMMGAGAFSSVGNVVDIATARKSAIVAASDNIDLAIETANQLVEQGQITEVQAAKFISEVESVAAVRGKIPAMVGADAIVDSAPLIEKKAEIDSQIAELEIQKAQADEAYQPMLQEQIEKLQTEKQALNEKIQSLATPTVEQEVTEVGTVEGEVAGDGRAVVEGVQDGSVEARVEGTPLANVLNKRGAIRDSDGNLVEGDVYIDGERVVLEAGGKIYDTLGSVDELSQMTAEQLPVQVVAPRITATEGGFTYNSDAGAMPVGTKITPQGTGLKSVKRDKNGNVKSVVVKDENGKTYNLKGEDAQAMAYELMMDEISKGNLDAKIVLNDEAANRINAAARPESTQGADSRTATQDATQQSDAAPARATERGDGGRGSRGERVGKSKPKQDGKTTEQVKEPLLEGVRDGGEQSQVGQESAELRSQKEEGVADANEVASTESVSPRQQAEASQGVREQDTKGKEATQKEKEVKGKTKEAKDISEVEKRKADRKKAIEASQAKAKNALEKMKAIIAKDSNVGFAKTADISDARKRLKEDKEFFGAVRDYVAANIEMGIASTQQIFEGLTQQLGALPADFRSAVKDIFNREVLGAYKTTYNKLNTLEKKALDKKRNEARRKMVSKVRAMLKPQNFEYKSADKVSKARVFKEARQAIRAVAESLDGVDLSLLSDDALIELQDGLMELYDRGTTAQKFINDMVDMAAREKGFVLAEFVAKKKGTIITNKDAKGALASLRTNSIVKYNGRFYGKSDIDLFKKIVEEDPDGNFEVIPRPASGTQARTKKFSLLSFLAPELEFETLLRGIASDNASIRFMDESIIRPALIATKNKDEANRSLALELDESKKRAFGTLDKAKKKLTAQATSQWLDPDGKEYVKGGMTNAQTLYVYMSVRQPDGFNRALAAGWSKEQLIELANYINSDSQLKKYANEYTDTFKIYLPKINEALETHGFSSERFAEKKYDDRSKFDAKDAEKYGEFFEVLDAIYDGKIPEIVPYTPLDSDGINSNEKTAYDVMSTNIAGKQLSIISNNALLRESGGVLQVNDPDVLFKSYADSMTNMVAKLPLLKPFNQMFSDANLNQIEDLFGRRVKDAIKQQANDTLLGKSQALLASADKNWLSWVVKATGLPMFLNTRSAIFQQLSRANYAISSMESEVLPEYFRNVSQARTKEMNIARKEVSELPWVKERFESSASNIDIQEINRRTGADGIPSRLLTWGYKLTQWSDVNAIVGGGTPYYKAIRDKEYQSNLNAGMDKDLAMEKAKEKASEELYITTQKTQQSSIEPLKSARQKSAVARMMLSFQTTNMQYTREMIRAISDVKNGRGKLSHNLTKILYYGAIQNTLFAAVSQAASTMLGDDDKDEEEARFVAAKVANTALNSILRGFGIVGAALSVGKDALWDLYVAGLITEEEVIEINENNQDKSIDRITLDVISNLAPPVGIKMRGVVSGIKDINYREEDEYIRAIKGYAKIGQAFTNIPLARAIEISEQFTDAVVEDLSYNERVLRAINLMSRYEMEQILEDR